MFTIHRFAYLEKQRTLTLPMHLVHSSSFFFSWSPGHLFLFLCVRHFCCIVFFVVFVHFLCLASINDVLFLTLQIIVPFTSVRLSVVIYDFSYRYIYPYLFLFPRVTYLFLFSRGQQDIKRLSD